MKASSDLGLPPSLAAKFVQSCQRVDADGNAVLSELVEEFLVECSAAEVAQQRRENPEGFISLTDMIARHGLDS